MQKLGLLLYEHASDSEPDKTPLQGLYKPLDTYTNEEIARLNFTNRKLYAAVLERLDLSRRFEVIVKTAFS